MAGLQDYLATVTLPDISSVDFGSGLEEMVSIINKNFQLIVSAPYLKGDHGNNVVVVGLPVYDSVSHCFTVFGTVLVNTIFGLSGVSAMTTSDGYDELVYAVSAPQSLSGINNPCEQLNPFDDNHNFINVNVDVLYEAYNESYTLASPYIFIDSRLNHLNEWNDSQRIEFYDYSCAVYGKAVDISDLESWALSKYNIMPTLYYDASIHAFCWLVDGKKSGIIAQGVVGENGSDSHIYFSRGSLEVATDINQVTTGRVVHIIEDLPGTTNIADYVDGSLAVVWFDAPYILGGNLNTAIIESPEENDQFWNTDNNSLYIYDGSEWVRTEESPVPYQPIYVSDSAATATYSSGYYYFIDAETDLQPMPFYSSYNMMIGLVKTTTQGGEVYKYIQYYEDYNLLNILRNLSLRQLCNSIGYQNGGDYESGLRGLYVRDNKNNPAPQDTDAVHMMFADNTDDEHLRVRFSEYHETASGSSPASRYVEDGTSKTDTLDIEYSSINLLKKTAAGGPSGVHMDNTNGVVIEKTVADGSGASTLLQLLGQTGSLKIKNTQNSSYAGSVKSFIPFTKIEVNSNNNVNFGLPYIGFIGSYNFQKGISLDSSRDYVLFDKIQPDQLWLYRSGSYQSADLSAGINATFPNLSTPGVSNTVDYKLNMPSVGIGYVRIGINYISDNFIYNDTPYLQFLIDYEVSATGVGLTTDEGKYFYQLVSHEDWDSLSNPGLTTASMKFYLFCERRTGGATSLAIGGNLFTRSYNASLVVDERGWNWCSNATGSTVKVGDSNYPDVFSSTLRDNDHTAVTQTINLTQFEAGRYDNNENRLLVISNLPTDTNAIAISESNAFAAIFDYQKEWLYVNNVPMNGEAENILGHINYGEISVHGDFVAPTIEG